MDAGLVHPHDRNGARLEGEWTTSRLEGACNAYREACYEAGRAARAVLRQLSERLVGEGADPLAAAPPPPPTHTGGQPNVSHWGMADSKNRRSFCC